MASASAGLQTKPSPLVDLEAQVLPGGTILFDRASFSKGSVKIHPGSESAEVELTTAKPNENQATTVDDKTGGGGEPTNVAEKKEDEKKEDQGEGKKEEDPEATKKAEEEKAAAEAKKTKEEDEKKKKKEDEEKKKKDEKDSFLRVVRNGMCSCISLPFLYTITLVHH